MKQAEFVFNDLKSSAIAQEHIQNTFVNSGDNIIKVEEYVPDVTTPDDEILVIHKNKAFRVIYSTKGTTDPT